jgi:hypothetical protein
VYQSGSKSDYKDGTTASVTSEVISGTSCTVNYKANYRERIAPTNGSYFTVKVYLFVSTISISS